MTEDEVIGLFSAYGEPLEDYEVLTDWFNKRKHYKKLMSEAYKKGDTTLGEYYNRLQHAYKIKLNDVYGCYAINGWRYTDGHKMISSAIIFPRPAQTAATKQTKNEGKTK